jgi:chromate reductase
MTSERLDIVGICGSLRKGSLNRKALLAAKQLMPSSFEMEIVEIGDLPIYNFDIQQVGFPPDATRLHERIKRADGVFVATPEHNATMPAALKNLIDWMSRFRPTPFDQKPVAVISASPGPIGGARVQAEFRRSMAVVNALVMIQPEVFIAHAPSKFDDNSIFTDEAGREFLSKLLIAFEDWIRRVKTAYPVKA